MKIKIHVTKEVLEKTSSCGIIIDGIAPEYTENCAIAYAVRDFFPNASVGYAYGGYVGSIFSIGIDSSGKDETQIALPPEAISFIKEFDKMPRTPEHRKRLEPMSFEVEVPQNAIEKIGIGEAYRILSESKTLELIAP